MHTPRTLEARAAEKINTHNFVRSAETLDSWTEFYPREYKPVPGYHSPKTWAWNAALSLYQMGTEQADDFRCSAMGACQMMQWQCPMYFIAPEMFTALDHTDYNQNINWRTLEMPFPCACFMIPIGSFSHPEAGAFAYIEYARMLDGTWVECAFDRFQVSGDHFYIRLVTGGFDVFQMELPKTLDAFNLHDPKHVRGEIDKMTFEDMTDAGWVNAEASRHMERGLRIIVNGVLWMMDRPAIVTPSRHLDSVFRKDGTVMRFWSPAIMGEHYKMRREPAEPGSGHHASPRPHVRRGHWRDQAYGPRHTLRRPQLIEPFWIGH
jgi:hypothetical protein